MASHDFWWTYRQLSIYHTYNVMKMPLSNWSTYLISTELPWKNGYIWFLLEVTWIYMYMCITNIWHVPIIVEPPVSDHQNVKPGELDHITGVKVLYGNWCNVSFMCQVNFEKKSDSSHREISVPCSTKEYDNVTTPYYPIPSRLSVKWPLTCMVG